MPLSYDPRQNEPDPVDSGNEPDPGDGSNDPAGNENDDALEYPSGQQPPEDATGATRVPRWVPLTLLGLVAVGLGIALFGGKGGDS
ncbi:MAG: hypothetical protein ACOCUS_00025 [Polyangiales bacterium]